MSRLFDSDSIHDVLHSLLTTRQVASILDCGVEHVRSLREQGALHGYRSGEGSWLFLKSEVDALAHARAQKRASATVSGFMKYG